MTHKFVDENRNHVHILPTNEMLDVIAPHCEAAADREAWKTAFAAALDRTGDLDEALKIANETAGDEAEEHAAALALDPPPRDESGKFLPHGDEPLTDPETFAEIVGGLTAKACESPWVQDAAETYSLSVGDSKVVVKCVKDRKVETALMNKDGKEVVYWCVSNTMDEWVTAKALYDAAEKKALGYDGVLGEVRKYLAKGK